MRCDLRVLLTPIRRAALLLVAMIAMQPAALAHVTTFGPKTYTIAADKKQIVTETFAATSSCDTNPDAVFTLIVTNGAADGTQRVSSGTVTLNGATVVSESDFNQHEAVITVPVRLAATNTLAIELKGGPRDGSITVSVLRHIDVTTAVIGPKKYVTTGRSDAFSDNFAATTPADPFTLVLRNGDGTTGSQVNSATVTLNGTRVVKEGDLHGSEAILVLPVTLQPLNTIALETKSDAPGAFVTLSILRHLTDADGPVIVLNGLVDHAIVAATPLAISGSVSDASGVATFLLNGHAVDLRAGGELATTIALTPGANRLLFDATDCEGNRTQKELTVNLGADTAPPQIAITAPPNGSFTNHGSVVVSGAATDDVAVASVTVNGQPATLNGSSWAATVTFAGEGAKTITAVATDTSGRQTTTAIQVTLDVTLALLSLRSELPALTYFDSQFIAGDVSDALSGVASVTCNGTAALVDETLFNCGVSLTPGDNAVTLVATDRAGNVTSLARTIKYVVDNDLPTITLAVSPQPNAEGWIRGYATLTSTCADATSGVSVCPRPTLVTGDGPRTFTLSASDFAGHVGSASIALKIDNTYPTLEIPDVRRIVAVPSVTLSGIARDAESGLRSVTCNGAPAVVVSDQFTCTSSLRPGRNEIEVIATDIAGNASPERVAVDFDNVAPAVVVDAPSSDQTLNSSTLSISGTATDNDSVASLTINGTNIVMNSDGSFMTMASLNDGVTALVIEAADRAGNKTVVRRTITRFSVPSIAITSPTDLTIVGNAVVAVQGVTGPTTTSIDVNGVQAAIAAGTFIAVGIPLQQGRTVITATARDAAGHVSTATIFVYRDSIPPRVRVLWPADGSVVAQPNITVAGTVDDVVVGTVSSAHVAVTVNGVPAVVSNRGFALPVVLQNGPNTLSVVATDQAGNSARTTVNVTYTAQQNHLTIVSGDAQTAPIGGRLAASLVVGLSSGSGVPIANAQVTFAVVQNDGTLAGSQQGGRRVVETTDAQGRASVTWTLGHRAGAGNERVDVTAAGATPVTAVASGTNGPPSLLVVDSGNGQFGATAAPLPRPLVAIVCDAAYNRLEGVPVTFRITAGGGSFDGASTIVVTTDADGRAIVRPTLGPNAGPDNNIVTATTPGVSTSAVFAASGLVAGDPAQTSIAGVVLDHTDLPIAGVSVRIVDTPLTTLTDATGQFRFDHVPVGYVRLFVDGSTAQRSGSWPTLEFSLYTIAGQRNPVPMPVHLLPIDLRRGLSVDDTTGGTIALPELPGFSLTIKPGTATFPGGGRTGTVSATLVHFDKVPMAPAFGQQPRFVVTVQPPGVHFDPPAPMNYPNLDGLPPGAITELYSFDHDLGQFIPIGTGSVSEDGTTIRSDVGVGLIKGGWQYTGPPAPVGRAGSISVQLRGKFHDFDPDEILRRGRSRARNARPPVHSQASTNTSTTPSDVLVGGQYDFIANGDGPENGAYQWEIIDDPGDATDDPSIAHWVLTPTCASASECQATLIGDRPGVVSVRVTFRNANTGSQGRTIRKVRFVLLRLSLKSIEFKVAPSETEAAAGGTIGAPMIQMIKDLRADASVTGQPTASAMLPPQWAAATAAANAKNDAILYVRKQTMMVTLKLHVDDMQPRGGVHGLILKGTVNGLGYFCKGVDIPDAADDLEIADAQMDVPLSDATHHYDPMTIAWQYYVGSVSPGFIDVTTHEVYVALDHPMPNRRLFLTSVKLALSGSDENNQLSVLQQTWANFGGPANVTSWDRRPIYYYRYPFGGGTSESGDPATNAVCLPNDDEGPLLLLSGTDLSAQCTGHATLLEGALAVNGIRSQRIKATAFESDGQQLFFLVPNWRFSSRGQYDGYPLAPTFSPYKWRFATSNGQLSLAFPASGSNTYGDLTSVSGIPGQNMETPSEKAFGNHVFILPQHVTDVNGAIQALSPKFYDPSYGTTYQDPNDFGARLPGFLYPTVHFPLRRGEPPERIAYPARKNDGSGGPTVVFCVYPTQPPTCTPYAP